MQTLTPKQKQVFQLLVLTGKKTRDLAKILGMSERTVKFHVENLAKIYGVSTRQELQALVMTRFLSVLSFEDGQRKFSSNPNTRAIQASEYLLTIFHADQSPLGRIFAERIQPKELKPKKVPSKK